MLKLDLSDLFKRLPMKTGGERLSDSIMSSISLTPALKIVVFIFCLILLSFVVVQSIYILLTFLLAICLSIPISSLRRGCAQQFALHDSVAILLVLMLFTISLSVMGFFLLPIFIDQISTLSENAGQYQERFFSRLQQSHFGSYLIKEASSPSSLIQSLSTNLQVVFKNVTQMLSSVSLIASGSLFVIALAFYLGYDSQRYVDIALRLFPKQHRAEALDAFIEIRHRLKFWLLGLLIAMSILGSATTLFLYALGIPLSLLLGMTVAMMVFIPNFGPLIAFIPIALVTFITEPDQLLYIVVFYTCIQCFEGFVLTPQIQERAVRVPAVLLLMAQLVFLNLFGFIGIITAFPIVVCMAVLIDKVYLQRVLGDSLDDAVI